jgi:hypothetical protein
MRVQVKSVNGIKQTQGMDPIAAFKVKSLAGTQSGKKPQTQGALPKRPGFPNLTGQKHGTPGNKNFHTLDFNRGFFKIPFKYFPCLPIIILPKPEEGKGARREETGRAFSFPTRPMYVPVSGNGYLHRPLARSIQHTPGVPLQARPG